MSQPITYRVEFCDAGESTQPRSGLTAAQAIEVFEKESDKHLAIIITPEQRQHTETGRPTL
jgi:hypothetical protein